MEIANGQGREVRQLGGAFGLLAAQRGGDGGNLVAHQAQGQPILRNQLIPPAQALGLHRRHHLPVEPGGGFHLVCIGEPDPAARQVDEEHAGDQRQGHQALPKELALFHGFASLRFKRKNPAAPPAARSRARRERGA